MKVGMNTSRTYSQGPTLPKPDSRVAGNLSQKIVSVLGRLSGENGPSHVTFTRNYVTSSAKKPITSATSKYLNKLQYLLKLDLLGHLGTGRNDAMSSTYVYTSQLKTPSFLMIATISTHQGPGSESCKGSDGRSCKDLGFFCMEIFEKGGYFSSPNHGNGTRVPYLISMYLQYYFFFIKGNFPLNHGHGRKGVQHD